MARYRFTVAARALSFPGGGELRLTGKLSATGALLILSLQLDPPRVRRAWDS